MNFRIYLTSTIVVAMLLIIYLNQVSKKPNKEKNGFNRLFSEKKALLPVASIDLKLKTMYIAGTGNNTIYLGIHMQPEKIIYTNDKLQFKDSLTLNFDRNIRIAWKILRVTVDSPSVFAHEALSPKIMKGEMPQLKMRNIPIQKIRGNEIRPMKNITFLLKTFDTSAKEFAIKRLMSPNVVTKSYYIPESDGDPLRAAGQLLFNKQWNEVVFTYTYKNGYLRLDSQLNQISSGKTIDTAYHFDVRTKELKSTQTIKVLAGTRVVNNYACTFDNKLYNRSSLNSDNFSFDDFKRYTVIDVYDYRASKYLYSIRLKKPLDLGFRDFCVIKDNMYVLYENQLVCFKIAK